MARFMPGARNKNRIRLLFEDLHNAYVDLSLIFFTNAVKCRAIPTMGESKRCFGHCRTHLHDQIRAIEPLFLVIIGAAADLLGVRRAARNKFLTSEYAGTPAIVIRHPQGATLEYRGRFVNQVVERLRNEIDGE